jgi:hypothetical protein
LVHSERKDGHVYQIIDEYLGPVENKEVDEETYRRYMRLREHYGIKNSDIKLGKPGNR